MAQLLSSRRAVLVGFSGFCLPDIAAATGTGGRTEGPEIVALQMDWSHYCRRFITDSGRVVDTANQNMSHSEGQSYAMLLAVAADDRRTFEQVWGWAQQNLARPGDSLLAWRWMPRQARGPGDMNNATDGDVIAAWALLRAHRAWGDPAHLAAARRIAQDVLDHCTVEWAGNTWLLPGAQGFRFGRRIVVNPSYYSFRAMAELSQVAPSSLWAKLRDSGLQLMEKARFGRHGLPADWVEVDGRGAFRPAEGWPPRFSYDAIRVPLHLAWSGHAPETMQAASRFWASRQATAMPAWVDLVSDASSPYTANVGIRAIAGLVRHRLGDRSPHWERVAGATNYYEASLVLLSLLALAEPPEAKLEPAVPPPAPQPEAWASRLWREVSNRLPARGEPVQVAMARGVAGGPRVAPPRWTRFLN